MRHLGSRALEVSSQASIALRRFQPRASMPTQVGARVVRVLGPEWMLRSSGRRVLWQAARVRRRARLRILVVWSWGMSLSRSEWEVRGQGRAVEEVSVRTIEGCMAERIEFGGRGFWGSSWV